MSNLNLGSVSETSPQQIENLYVTGVGNTQNAIQYESTNTLILSWDQFMNELEFE